MRLKHLKLMEKSYVQISRKTVAEPGGLRFMNTALTAHIRVNVLLRSTTKAVSIIRTKPWGVGMTSKRCLMCGSERWTG